MSADDRGEVQVSDEQRRVLDAMLRDLLEQPHSGRLLVAGREVRFALEDLGRERAAVVIQSCVPCLLAVNEAGDTFHFGLDGLLAVTDDRPRRLLDTMLKLVASRYREPGGRRQRTILWSDVRRAGAFSAVDHDVAYILFMTARLGDGGRPPLRASHDPMAPTYDYEFQLREQDLEAMADNSDAARWARFQRERARMSNVPPRIVTLASSSVAHHAAGVRREHTTPKANSNAPELDLAVITILPEEYRAVLGCLDAHQHVVGHEPNLYSWRTGQLRTAAGEYSVVVALAGDPTNPIGAVVTHATVVRFKPRYVVVLGVAGGFRRDKGNALELGDVVVSRIIHGYEYGKITHTGFQPRSDFSHRADPGLVNAARAFISSGECWWDSIKGQPPHSKPHHRAEVGEVASGDKVIDYPDDGFFKAVHQAWPQVLAVEMEGAGAAAAIEALKGLGRDVGLVMVRGISDLPGHGGGTSERDAWKAYAAESAARFLFALVRHTWPLQPLANP